MNNDVSRELDKLVETYKAVVQVMEVDAKKAIRDEGRAYGGFVRSAKGKMQEFLTHRLIEIAWGKALRQDMSRLEINSKKIRIPVKDTYVPSIKDRRVREYLESNRSKLYYGLSVDKHAFVDGRMVLGVECKAYTENAMLKRILVDFYLLRTKIPDLQCYLFQLESQLGGDYQMATGTPLGSGSTHTLMSYFPGVDLKIVTLLKGERRVERPINKAEYFKPLPKESLEMAVGQLVDGIRSSGVRMI